MLKEYLISYGLDESIVNRVKNDRYTERRMLEKAVIIHVHLHELGFAKEQILTIVNKFPRIY